MRLISNPILKAVKTLSTKLALRTAYALLFEGFSWAYLRLPDPINYPSCSCPSDKERSNYDWLQLTFYR